ncbi:hypothetical protein PybrP1_002750 [[Pythium] brassicae (nom. inval.)]|nr:hypothetical protein PybrP1_002750 [[Pythium] brassicae (nom. inval.)]
MSSAALPPASPSLVPVSPASPPVAVLSPAAARTPPLGSNDPGRMYLPHHIVVLVHGNNGAPADFDAVEAALLRKFGPAQVLIIKSAANHTQTSLGVEVGGARLAEEVYRAVFEYELHPDADVYKLSIVGHSLGGLYARFAIVPLIEKLSPLNVDYVSFVTICTPHLGSRRPRSESALKNVWRMGVHSVLGSRTIYGQTGIDLLVDNKRFADEQTDNDTADLPPPLLEAMCSPDSAFIKALQRFRFGTLVAMTDGDVVVPYASASIRNFNPYPSVPLTERFPEWRWHIHHSGFEDDTSSSSSAVLLQLLDDKVDKTVEVEQLRVGVDVSASPRYTSVEGYDADNKQEVEFSYTMIESLQQAVPWRRIDVSVEPLGVKGKLRLHDWALSKMQPPGCRADEFIELLCAMIGHDHSMEPLPPSTDEAPRAEPAAGAQQSGDSDERLRGSFVGNGIGRIVEKFQQKRSESVRLSLSQEVTPGNAVMSPAPLFRRSSSANDEPRGSFVNAGGIGRFFDKFQAAAAAATSAQPSPSSAGAGDKPRNSFGAGFTQLLDKFQKKTTAPSSESTASNSPPPPHPGPPQAATSLSSSEVPTGGGTAPTVQQDVNA